MKKNAELLATSGDATANRAYLLAYQKSILFALYRDGILDQEQMDRCIEKL